MKKNPESGGASSHEVAAFIIKLGEAAHAYGSTAPRLEAYLSRVSAVRGCGGVFRSTPTEIVFALQSEAGPSQRPHPSVIDPGRQARVPAPNWVVL